MTAGAGGGQSPARFKGPIAARFTRAPAGGGGAAPQLPLWTAQSKPGGAPLSSLQSPDS